MEIMSDNLRVDMNCANEEDHMAAAEQNNHIIKESMRATCHRSGCTTTPKQMIIALAEHSVEQLNMFPAKHGISECCSPETIITGQTIDCTKHCQHEFGTCVQAHHQPQKKNSMKKFKIDAICDQLMTNKVDMSS